MVFELEPQAWLQTHPLPNLAAALPPYLATDTDAGDRGTGSRCSLGNINLGDDDSPTC